MDENPFQVLSLLTLNNHLPICLQNTNWVPDEYTADDLEKPKKRKKSIAKSINKVGVGGYEYPLITEDMYDILIDKKTFKGAKGLIINLSIRRWGKNALFSRLKLLKTF